MQKNFDRSLDWVLAHEGGYVNHPKDPGGATNMGVTQRTYDADLRRRQLPSRSVQLISMEEVKAIYRSQYWDKVGGDELPGGLDYCLFDFAVNSGVSRAVKFMQRQLGVKTDGIVGVNTMEAVDRADVEGLIQSICQARFSWLKTLRHWGTFGRGWTRRVMGESLGVQARDTGVIDRAVYLHRELAVIHAPSYREDGSGARAEDGERSLSATVKGLVKSGKGWTNGGALGGGAIALTQLEGPVAYAVAAALLIAAVTVALYFLRAQEAAV
ncbi:glycoside hydrolase family 108 protein [Phaeobacter sp. JH209A]|uniref:glycoside hydrolase family 108 protein n=1 Tax=Phaeobacter sp. JH209A TaxID=3112505 RepID=UPI003A8B66AF